MSDFHPKLPRRFSTQCRHKDHSLSTIQAERAKSRGMESNDSYFRRRATEEKAAALKSLHTEARQRHLEMAKRYEDLTRLSLASDSDVQPPRPNTDRDTLKRSLDDRSPDDWLVEAEKYRQMAHRLKHNVELSKTFIALANDARQRAGEPPV